MTRWSRAAVGEVEEEGEEEGEVEEERGRPAWVVVVAAARPRGGHWAAPAPAQPEARPNALMRLMPFLVGLTKVSKLRPSLFT
jgi:hypothetical protein